MQSCHITAPSAPIEPAQDKPAANTNNVDTPAAAVARMVARFWRFTEAASRTNTDSFKGIL